MENTIVFPFTWTILTTRMDNSTAGWFTEDKSAFRPRMGAKRTENAYISLTVTNQRQNRTKQTPKQQKKQSHENREKQTSIDKFQVIFTFLNGTSLVDQYI